MNRITAVIASLVSLALVTGCSKKENDSARGAPSATSEEKAAPAAGSASPSSKAPDPPFEERVASSKPLEVTPEQQTVPGSTVTAEVCEVEGGPVLAASNMDLFRAVRVVGDRLFVITGADDTIRAYKIAAGAKCKLTVDTSWNGGSVKVDKAEVLAKDDAGNLYASTGVFGSKRFGKDGKENGKCDARPLGRLFVHPAGKLGIGTFANATVAKVTLRDEGACKTEPWAFTDLGQAAKRKGPFTNAQAVGFVGETIFMGAIIAKEVDPNGPTIVAALDANGREKFRFGSTEKGGSGDDRFGWVHAIAPCKVGVCVLDSNHRRVTMWKPTGEHVGSVKLSKLFDLKYPWIADFDFDKNGSSWFVTGQDREGAKKVAEGTIYRVKGL